MKRAFLLHILAALVVLNVFSQVGGTEDPLVGRFNRTGVDGKVALLRRMQTEPRDSAEGLYLAALDFTVNRMQDARVDPRIEEIGTIAIELLWRDRLSGDPMVVWRFLVSNSDFVAQTAAVNVLGLTGADLREDIAASLAQYLLMWNNLARSGEVVSPELVAAAVSSLAEIGHPSAFNALFDTATHPMYAAPIPELASEALLSLDIDFDARLEEVLANAPFARHDAAFDFSVRSINLPRESRVTIARRALQYTMDSSHLDPSDAQSARELRYEAALRLSELGAFEPISLAIRYFDAVLGDYERRDIALIYVIQAVGILGQTGDDVCAQRLDEVLRGLNVKMEFDAYVSDQLVIALIEELGRLEYAPAADTLLETQLLDFPRQVRQLAQDIESQLRGSRTL